MRIGICRIDEPCYFMLVVFPVNGITIYDEVPPVERATGISLFITHSDEIVKAFHLLLLIDISPHCS